MSLAEHQSAVLSTLPLEVEKVQGFVRDLHWRPLAVDELRAAERRQAQFGHWPNKEIVDEGDAYWRRT